MNQRTEIKVYWHFSSLMVENGSETGLLQTSQEISQFFEDAGISQEDQDFVNSGYELTTIVNNEVFETIEMRKNR